MQSMQRKYEDFDEKKLTFLWILALTLRLHFSVSLQPRLMQTKFLRW